MRNDSSPSATQHQPPGSSEPRRLLLDGDVVAWTVACRCMDRMELPELADQIEAEVEHWGRLDRTADLTVCLSSGTPFRRWVWPQYKANRSGRTPPPMLRHVFEVLRTEYETWAVEGLEGDDGLGILGTSLPGAVIVTIDKDLQQVPGHHFDPRTGVLREITPDEGAYALHLQWLMGDPTDNVPGLRRVGPKRAAKMLDGVPVVGYRAAVEAAYAAAGHDEEYIRQMERCVRILTRRDWT